MKFDSTPPSSPPSGSIRYSPPSGNRGHRQTRSTGEVSDDRLSVMQVAAANADFVSRSFAHLEEQSRLYHQRAQEMNQNGHALSSAPSLVPSFLPRTNSTNTASTASRRARLLQVLEEAMDILDDDSMDPQDF